MKNTLLMLCLVVSAVGCNQVASVTKKQSDAVTAAVKATCDRYAACPNGIGTGDAYKYQTRSDCENDQSSYWNGHWTVADCDGKINGTNLNTCTDAIDSTSCTNFVDQLNTAYEKCSSDDVCNGK